MAVESSNPALAREGFLRDRIRAFGDPAPMGRSRARLVRGTLGLVNRTVALCDGLATFLGVVLCRRPFIGIEPPLDWAQTLIIAAVAATSVAITLQFLGAYRVERYRQWRDWMVDLVLGWTVAMFAGVMVIGAFAPAALALHRCLVVWALAALVVMTTTRAGVGVLFAQLNSGGFIRRRVAVIGANDLGDTVVRRLQQSRTPVDYELVGVFDDSARRDNLRSAALAGDVDDLCLLAQRRQVDMIVLAVPWRRSTRIFELAQRIQWISADVVVPFEASGLLSGSRLVTEVGGIPMLQLVHHPFKGTQGLVKVAQDYVVASLALLLAAPFMALVALAVRLTSDGPVLFRQARMGFNGRPFHIFKFRTMTVDPNDDGSVGATLNDPRITPVGALLRRTSIDELPQLFNVLRGEMSIVGPRPHVPNMLVGQGSYVETVQSYAARHRIKPGITGWAQINGMRGGIDTPAKARDGVDLDLYYIRNWSLKLDLEIMLKTVTGHLVGPGF
jgi:Undecaprenyl-phosphate glucose phosphotransferase